ncbi:hypothetical protein G7Y89_g13577 [Cudoniella acicularis]|uniref:Rhodopsin domain-containing protein n=1 Tax=Cudoniella acicularis TaxID=354080 RepID=A0A8H4R7Z3_9HELO|nr:hypothetical protein G7Y89_g13577 [Cudoniella acicularis]
MSSTNGGAPTAGAVAGAPMMPMGPLPSPFTTTLLSVEIVFLLLATVAVGARVHSSRISSRSRWLTIDLLLIIAALVVTYGCIIATIIGAAMVGLDFISDRLGVVGASQFAFKIYFSDVITTTAASGLCKVSILEFYKRIFITKGFQRMCNAGIFLVSAWMIGTSFTQLFSTTPISSAWHPERQLKDANYDYPTALLAIFGIGIVLDFLVLCLPLRSIYKLQLKWANKIKVSLILWLGIFCVICASVRFYYSYKQLAVVFEATAQDKGSITIMAAMWSKLEPSASIIAACLPTYGPLLSHSSIGSMVKSARSFFSISSRNRSRSISGANKEYDSRDDNVPGHNWHELRPNTRSHKVDTEANSTQSLTRPNNGYIGTASEITVAHQSTA